MSTTESDQETREAALEFSVRYLGAICQAEKVIPPGIEKVIATAKRFEEYLVGAQDQ